MILYSFTVIFTSFFQSNIELWIHFFSVDKISCKCEGNVFQKKRLIVTKKKSFFILQKSFSDQKTSSPTKHLSWWCKNFCEHIKTCPSKTLFYLWDKMTKAFFQLMEKFSFFLTVGETFTRGIDSTDEHFTEGSLKKSRWLERTLQRSLFHYLQNFIQYNIRHRFSHTFYLRIKCTQSVKNYSQKTWQFSTYSTGSWYGIVEIS